MRRLPLLTGIIALSLTSWMFFLKGHISAAREETDEKLDAPGFIDYMNRIRANQVTGIVDPNDELKARAEANAMTSSRSLGIEWHEMGPDNIGGRTRAVLFDAKNQNVVYAGGVSGGLWKSIDGGQAWQNVGDQYNSLTIASLAQAPNGDIYFGTGEGLYGNFGFGAGGFVGQGMWKSTDGGNTFNQLPSTIPVGIITGFTDWANVNRIAVSPNDPNRVYAATNRGLKVSHDGGATWAQVQGILGLAASSDVKIGSDGYVHTSAGNKYYRSTSPDGDVFELRAGKGGFPNTSFSRIEIAVSPSDPNYVYIAAVNSSGGMGGVFQSTDGGLDWIQIGPANSANFNPYAFFEPASSGQGDYDNTVAVAPSDPQTIFVGGSGILYRYTPSTGWLKIVDAYVFPFLGYYIHPDMHAIVFNPFRPNQMIIGTDGGVYMTDDALLSQPLFYTVDRNYRVTQMYSVAAAQTGEVMGGTQDNSTVYIDFLGNTVMSAHELFGGDGGYTEISKTNPSAFFGGRPYGVLFRSPAKGAGGVTFFDNRIDANGDGQMDDGAEFVTPFVLWEKTDSPQIAFYAAGSNKRVWLTLGSLNFSIVPDWFALPFTIGAISTLAFSKDGNHLFAGTTSGYVYHYANLRTAYDSGKFTYPSVTSKIWNAVDSGITITSVNVGSGRYIRAIAIDPNDYNKIVVTAANYGNTSYVWSSTNALSSPIVLTDITGNLPQMPVYGAALDVENPNTIIVGTELGVYSKDLTTGDWSEENTGMTKVPTLMVRQIPFNGIPYLYIATHGRGIFRSGTLASVNDGIPPQNANIDNVMIFPNPASTQATVKIVLAHPSGVMLDLYDLSGRHIRSIDLHQLPSGENVTAIKTNDLANGTYLLSVRAGPSVFNQKMIVVK